MQQITIEEFLRKKNEGYALQCRHYRGGYCYITDKTLGHIQCPCKDFEEHKFCDGCIRGRNNRKMIAHECFSCYRFWFNPDVMTKDMEDKWTDGQ